MRGITLLPGAMREKPSSRVRETEKKEAFDSNYIAPVGPQVDPHYQDQAVCSTSALIL
ncbi:MAG: hypothetical protein JRJ69_15860 [Deltaproteobacteria bacterium]|nr:hypothetical protein [Deltaproteobacteria bacterium]MBW2035624.1 hypothetical protein [Deltaproteobacteria bacterium]